MVNNAEAIGRLIANDTLLKGERQLLRKQDQPSQQLDGEPAQPTALPISHNDKAMASVLLTLLDEQLDASISEMASPSGAAPGSSSSSEAAASSNRILARYAENAPAVRNELPGPGTAIPLDQSSQKIMQAATSPELQTYIQRFLMSAAARVQTDDAEGPSVRLRRQNRSSLPDPATMRRIAGAALILTLALAAIVARFAG
jgi:hypothetical protein